MKIKENSYLGNQCLDKWDDFFKVASRRACDVYKGKTLRRNLGWRALSALSFLAGRSATSYVK